jgi:molybdopterin/thiamine biosynthesis adenylyltransferase/proteasome lid subunit RPN8/RPN11
VRPVPGLTEGQRQALGELRRLASENVALSIVHDWPSGASLFLDVSVDCSDLRPANDGLRLRARERFIIRVPPDFPFAIPTVSTRHTRWAGTPHVQWGRHLCLYVSPTTEWNPSDGMAGFIERLVLWLERASAGQLDAVGEPLHPPVAYPSAEAGIVVVRANAPRASVDAPWLGIALLNRVTDERVDLVGWCDLEDPWPMTHEEACRAAGLAADGARVVVAFAVMLPRPITFEYPDTATAMVEAIAAYGVDGEVMLGMLGVVASINRRLGGSTELHDDEGAVPPLYLLVGTPARGIVGSSERLTHLAAWRLPPLAEQIARLVPKRHSQIPELAQIGREILSIGQRWLSEAKTSWARVYEARSEIVTARDAGTPASWLGGRKVLVLGAGALGAPIADACVRAGANRVVVADHGIVHPGILVRQPYDDPDVGQPKALILAERLARIRPDVDVEPVYSDVVTALFDEGSPPPDFDLVIDATADRTVRTVIERRRTRQRSMWPTLVTVLIGHDARRGIATISPPGSSGAGADILRRLSLAARADATGDLGDVVDDFFPDPPRTDLFQPEPGCSDVTFVGSAADVNGLAGQLLAGSLHALSMGDPEPGMLALVVRMPISPLDAPSGGSRWFRWPNDEVILTPDRRYEVRLAASAVAEMRAEARRGARVRAARVETGGSLLGGFDSAAGVVWVDEATGPPPDSELSEMHFDHGVEGLEERITTRREATARVSTFVGIWHSHPFNDAWPSERDEQGMATLTLPVPNAPRRALLLIVGGESKQWRTWLAEGASPGWYARVVDRTTARRDIRMRPVSPVIDAATTWSGGSWSSVPTVGRSRWSSIIGRFPWPRRKGSTP